MNIDFCPIDADREPARTLLAATLAEYQRIYGDTDPGQPHARALYESAGYTAIPDYNANPYAAYWGEKRL
ncbi:MAG: hypothetical protein AVDCRST_MAG17-16 [uncultured Solirubrobacterales bacterium]|uniref:N-acetyltransferase domain-containing protein n=1 Tax=uncultured Solirubrobacterales bacterium TaxID=768556 RepID=A0A6J4RPJ2_9ACTN|nr:MAG: hypothetical protein AVDCRST_MAG17-16 [uncultured Solirubrobacterales bacterium]